MAENTSPLEEVPIENGSSEAEHARLHGQLLYCDGFVQVHGYGDAIYVNELHGADRMMVLQALEMTGHAPKQDKPAPSELDKDRAVREAGFATEPLRKALEDAIDTIEGMFQRGEIIMTFELRSKLDAWRGLVRS